jgi:hypothetical protein
MGRPYAKLYRDIWADPDFCALGPEARYVYVFLFSQPDLNAAGVLSLTVRRWATRAAITANAITAALAILGECGYVVTDENTEELLVRTFIRNDGLWRIPNTLYAVVRDAERTVSPTLRATLAAELALLPVDELTGKRAADMKAQVTRVTATLRATLSATVEPRSGMRVRVWDEGAGVSPGSYGAVVNQSEDRYARADLTDLIQQEIRKATGSDITLEQAAGISEYILGGRDVSDAAAYVRAVIRGERDPRTRFLPAPMPPPPPVPNGAAAGGDTVHTIAAQARHAITREDT